MKTPNNIERDLDRIRLKIYEETKHLTPKQYVERINKKAEILAKQYGFKVLASAKSK